MNPLLMKIARDTVSISKNEKYSLKGKEIKLPERKDSILITTVEKTNIINNNKEENQKQFKEKIEIREEGTVDTIFYSNSENLGVLNFASARHPGGGFLNGAVAQEECLAYCSTLYADQLNSPYYTINANNKSKFYTDTMIVSETTFFRDSKYNLVEDFQTCTVITCPAVNMKIAKNTLEAKQVMKDRMRKILDVFIKYNIKNLILGAYGCGVFGNLATDVAKNWKDLLIEERYIQYFDKIYFSIPGGKNLKDFKVILKKE